MGFLYSDVEDYHADIYAKDIVLEKDHSECMVYAKNQAEPLGRLYLTMPGKHNLSIPLQP